MKTLYTLLFLVLTLNVFSQSISGTIYEMETGDNVLFATIAVYKDGKLLTGTESDFDGKYKIENLEPGDYVLEYTYLGLETYKDSITINSDITEYNILLEEAYLLFHGEIVITDCYIRSCYSGCITPGCGCTIRGIEIDTNTTEIPEIIEQATKTESSIFPNPAYDHVTIESDQEIDQVMIFDQLGKLVYKETILNPLHRVDLSNYPSGFYTVNTFKGNSLISSDKLIVENRL